MRMLTFRELNAVSKVLFSLVQSNHERFVAEMQKLSAVKSELQIAEVICKNGRSYLKKSEEVLIKRSFEVLKIYRRKENLCYVLEEVLRIKRMCGKLQEAKRLLKGLYYFFVFIPLLAFHFIHIASFLTT